MMTATVGGWPTLSAKAAEEDGAPELSRPNEGGGNSPESAVRDEQIEPYCDAYQSGDQGSAKHANVRVNEGVVSHSFEPRE